MTMALGLGLGLPFAGAASGSASLPSFAYEAETNSLITAKTAAGNTMSTRKERTSNYWIKKLKDGGVWAKLTRLWIGDDADAGSLINWITPGTGNLTKVSTPTFKTLKQDINADLTNATTGLSATGFKAGSASTYLDTGIALNSINTSNFSFGCYLGSGSAGTSWDAGAVDAVATSGILLKARDSTTNTMSVRCFTGNIATLGATTDWDNSAGHYAMVRNNSADFDVYHNGKKIVTTTSAVVASVQTTTLTFIHANGLGTAPSRPFIAGFYGQALTATEMDLLYRAMRSIIESNLWGDVYIHEPGYQPQSNTADVIVYGWTGQGVMAAYEAARQGRSVIMVGGWRDRTAQHIGGMTANGLGFVDLNVMSAIGGLPRLFFHRTNAADSRTDNSAKLQPRTGNWIFRQMLDPARTGGLDIKLFATNGVASVAKAGTDITSITTTDGRTFSGSVFIDASYEGDLMALSGASYIVGREAAGSSAEAANGYRGNTTGTGGNLHQTGISPATPGTIYTIDPYVTPGVPASGLLSGVVADPGTTLGAADGQVQNYNFRVTMTDSTMKSRQRPISTTPPTGYSAASYEVLGRLTAAAGASYALTDVLTSIDVIGNMVDVNNRGGMSTDYFGGGTAYAAANYAGRETIWKAHENWIRGLFYYLGQDPDSRVAATAARTSMAGFGYSCEHYLDPHPNDEAYWPGQLYVREMRRMTGSALIWNGNDIAATDGTTPRSTNTISVASYPMDSHQNTRMADLTGTPRVWNEGGLFNNSAGAVDLKAPLPYEIYVPGASECTNLGVLFAVAATHVAFGSIRMEATAFAAGQALGYAAALKCANPSWTMQDVGTTQYSTLRTGLLASATLSAETAPNLPQVN